MATTTVLYPTKEGSTFDMDYYLQKHMPLVTAKWGSYGLTQWLVTDLRGTEQPYSVQATLIWESAASFDKAREAAGAEVFADIPNFSSEQPIVLFGGVKAKKQE